jgi:hypothetical protein
MAPVVSGICPAVVAAAAAVAGSTWDREVATVNRFYWWALIAGYVAAYPIPQR